MWKRVLTAALLLMPVAGPVQANGVDITLSDETASVVYLVDGSSLGYGGADIGVGLLYNEEGDIMITGNLLVVSNPPSGVPHQFGVGAKAYVADLDIDETASAIGVGALYRYLLPSETPMGLAVEAYAAPSVTSFSGTERFYEVMARFEIEIVPSTRGYIGYRWIETRLEDIDDDYKLDDSFHVGVRIFF